MSNDKNAKNVFEDTLKTTMNNFCSNYSNHVSQWLSEEKNIEVTPEELCSCFDLPYKPPSTPGISAASIQTQMPNYYANTGAITPSGKKKGGRTRKNVDPNAKKCEYKMTRGKSEGKQCENPILDDENVIGGDRYCKQCLGKAAVKKILEKPDDKPVVKPPTREGDSVSCNDKQKSKPDELSVVAIEGKPGWFREENHGFIVEQTDAGEIVAHRIEVNGEERDLDEDEKNIAINIGLRLVKKTTLSVNSNGSTIPVIPNVEVSN